MPRRSCSRARGRPSACSAPGRTGSASRRCSLGDNEGKRPMAVMDVQVHAYERSHPGRPWVGTLTGVAEVTGDQMVAAMDAVGVDGAILVSPFSMYRYDASYAKQVYAAHPDRFGLIKPVDPTDPAVADTIADWAATPGTVGVRIMLNRDDLSRDPADPGFTQIGRAL